LRPEPGVAYSPVENWQVAVEMYSDFGQFKDFAPRSEQAHQIFGVIDHTTKGGFEMEFGAGVGLTNASDKFTLKLILAKDLNKKK
jgi:hypothetical protein